MTDIILCGVGGQGTVLAGKLIATAAMNAGRTVIGAETIGMAQRGGSVMSCMRVDSPSDSPLCPPGSAQLLLAFEPAEAVRCLPYLAKDGVAVVSSRPVQPVTASLSGGGYDRQVMLDYLRQKAGRLIVVDTEAMAGECGSPKVVNVLLLAAAAACGALGFSPDELEQALRQAVPPRFLELNLRALRLGAGLRENKE